MHETLPLAVKPRKGLEKLEGLVIGQLHLYLLDLGLYGGYLVQFFDLESEELDNLVVERRAGVLTFLHYYDF